MQSVERRMTTTPAFELEATTESYMPDGRISSRGRHKVRFLRPKHFRIESRSSYRTGGDTLSAEFRGITAVDSAWSSSWSSSSPTETSSMRTPHAPYFEIKSIVTAWDADADLIYAREWNAKRVHDESLISLKYLGQREWNGAVFQVVQWVWREKWLAPEDAYLDTTYFYVAPDQTVRRIRTHTSKGSVVEEQINKITLDANLTQADVAFNAPVPAKLIDSHDDTKSARVAAAMIGKAAPGFAIPTAQGDTIRLSDQLAKKRATIIFTWFYG
jgi:hypothetical protein